MTGAVLAREAEGRSAVFVDKDGTLLHDVPYNVDPSLIRFHDGALEGLTRLSSAGHALVLVTNQSGVAHGYFSEDQLRKYLAELERQLASGGVHLTGAYYCPHHPDAAQSRFRRFCSCRKPNPGMLAQAAAEHGFDLHRSWMVGDLLDDIEAGARAGCLSALVNHDGNERIPETGIRRPHLIAPSLAEAAVRIIGWHEAVA